MCMIILGKVQTAVHNLTHFHFSSDGFVARRYYRIITSQDAPVATGMFCFLGAFLLGQY